ncbi:MAG: hypothetical protein R3322_21935, partial [Kiloniellales bacterium]|nr:hypothetical protein [Kiloniellales bacterium]
MKRRIARNPVVWASLALAGALLGGSAAGSLAETAAGAAEREVAADSRTALTVTIYNRGLGLVRDVRRLDFEAGESVLALADVSPALRAESLALAGEGLSVLEQSFVFDLLSPQRILEKSVGGPVWVVRSHPETGEESEVEAELLAVDNGVVL